METVLRKKRPKSDYLRAEIESLAVEMGPGKRLPSVRQMCLDFDVAKVTIGSVLDEIESRGIIQRRRGSGIYVSPLINQKTIGLVFGQNIFSQGVSPFCRILIEHCRQQAEIEHVGFATYLDLALNPGGDIANHRNLKRDIADRRLHGIMLVWRENNEEEKWLRRQNLPVVSFSTEPTDNAATGLTGVVTFDYLELVRMGVRELVERGRRRIGLVTPFGYIRPADPELQAFRTEIENAGLPWNPARVWENRTVGPDKATDRETREEQGYKAVRELYALDPAERPDAILVLDDMMTRGVLPGLRRLDLEPGRDVLVATHANRGTPTLSAVEEGLILLEADPAEIVAAMFTMMESLMKQDQSSPGHVMVKPKLRVVGLEGKKT